jgi:hypothetical protein
VWTVSFLWVVPIVGWHHFFNGGKRSVPDDVCDTEYAKNSVLKIITSILNYFLPLGAMYALYTKIFVEVSSSANCPTSAYQQICCCNEAIYANQNAKFVWTKCQKNPRNVAVILWDRCKATFTDMV